MIVSENWTELLSTAMLAWLDVFQTGTQKDTQVHAELVNAIVAQAVQAAVMAERARCAAHLESLAGPAIRASVNASRMLMSAALDIRAGRHVPTPDPGAS